MPGSSGTFLIWAGAWTGTRLQSERRGAAAAAAPLALGAAGGADCGDGFVPTRDRLHILIPTLLLHTKIGCVRDTVSAGGRAVARTQSRARFFECGVSAGCCGLGWSDPPPSALSSMVGPATGGRL